MIMEETIHILRKLVGGSKNGNFYTEDTLTRVGNYLP